MSLKGRCGSAIQQSPRTSRGGGGQPLLPSPQLSCRLEDDDDDDEDDDEDDDDDDDVDDYNDDDDDDDDR